MNKNGDQTLTLKVNCLLKYVEGTSAKLQEVKE